MNRITTLARIAITIALAVGTQHHGQAGAISKRIETQIKSNVVPAFQNDDLQSIEKILSNWVTKFDGEELDEIDAILESNGSPSIGRLLLDARMAKLLSGATQKKTQPRELTRSLPVLQKQIDDIVRDVKEASFFDEVVPDSTSMQDYHDTLWHIHVAKNELHTAKKLARYGQRLTEQVKSTKSRGLSDHEQKILDLKFAGSAKLVDKTLDELNELKTEIQILALGSAARIVRESPDYKERLRAGYILSFSATPVLETLKDAKPGDFDRPLLQADRLRSSVEASVRYAKESSPEVITQARLLFLGMHWWMRGRYGQGPDGMGLLKSVQALQSTQAQFPLYMPVEPPTPTEFGSASYGYSVPKFDRRHHYIWMYEYRSIQEQQYTARDSSSISNSRITSRTKLPRFY